jgi:hypothetical protein
MFENVSAVVLRGKTPLMALLLIVFSTSYRSFTPYMSNNLYYVLALPHGAKKEAVRPN